MIASPVSSSSSAEPEDLLRIELSRDLHTNSLMIARRRLLACVRKRGEGRYGRKVREGWVTSDVRDWVMGEALTAMF